MDDEKDQFDTRFDIVIDRFVGFNTIIEEDIESIAKLEKKSSDITSKMSINYALKKIDDEILLLENKNEVKEPQNEDTDSDKTKTYV